MVWWEQNKSHIIIFCNKDETILKEISFPSMNYFVLLNEIKRISISPVGAFPFSGV